MRVDLTTFGVALLLGLSTFITTSNATPEKNLPDVSFKKPPKPPVEPLPKKSDLCYVCAVEVIACTNAYLAAPFNPELDGGDYQRNCECQQYQFDRFCRVNCAAKCIQHGYEGPYDPYTRGSGSERRSRIHGRR